MTLNFLQQEVSLSEEFAHKLPRRAMQWKLPRVEVSTLARLSLAQGVFFLGTLSLKFLAISYLRSQMASLALPGYKLRGKI